MSKDIEVPKRINIAYTNMDGDSYAQEHVNFGSVGDLPSGFEIYTVTTGATFQIDDNPVYTIGATNLYDLAVELNGATGPGISDFNYNIVSGYTGGTHTGTGATGMVFDHYVKVIATNKGFKTNTPVSITYGQNIIGTTYGRNLSTNPSWDTLRPIKYSTDLDNLTKVNFTYDNSAFHGGKNPIWKIHKENDSSWEDIYYTNRYLAYLFTERGSYTVSLHLEDTNGNGNEIIKKEFIKIT